MHINIGFKWIANKIILMQSNELILLLIPNNYFFFVFATFFGVFKYSFDIKILFCGFKFFQKTF